MLDNRVHQLWLGSYVNGWLAGLSDGEAVRVAQAMARVDIPIQVGTMLTELAPLFILFRRKLAALMIFACANLLTATYGATADEALFVALQGLEDGVEPETLLERYAVSRFDAERTAEFEAYLQTYFSRLNERDGDKDVVPGFLEAPHHQTAKGGAVPSDPWVDIVAVGVFARDIYYDGDRLVPPEDVEILEVRIPSSPVEFEPAGPTH